MTDSQNISYGAVECALSLRRFDHATAMDEPSTRVERASRAMTLTLPAFDPLPGEILVPSWFTCRKSPISAQASI